MEGETVSLNPDEAKLATYLTDHPGPASANDMCNLFRTSKDYKIPPVRRVRNALRKLVKTGIVCKLAHGVYEIA